MRLISKRKLAAEVNGQVAFALRGYSAQLAMCEDDNDRLYRENRELREALEACERRTTPTKDGSQ